MLWETTYVLWTSPQSVTKIKVQNFLVSTIKTYFGSMFQVSGEQQYKVCHFLFYFALFSVCLTSSFMCLSMALFAPIVPLSNVLVCPYEVQNCPIISLTSFLWPFNRFHVVKNIYLWAIWVFSVLCCNLDLKSNSASAWHTEPSEKNMPSFRINKGVTFTLLPQLVLIFHSRLCHQSPAFT